MPIINNDIFKILLDLHKGTVDLLSTFTKIKDIVLNHNITVFNLLDKLKNIFDRKFCTE